MAIGGIRGGYFAAFADAWMSGASCSFSLQMLRHSGAVAPFMADNWPSVEFVADTLPRLQMLGCRVYHVHSPYGCFAIVVPLLLPCWILGRRWNPWRILCRHGRIVDECLAIVVLVGGFFATLLVQVTVGNMP